MTDRMAYAQPGVEVAIVDTRAYDPTCTVRTVKRRTATQIVLDNGDRYSVNTGRKVGKTYGPKKVRPVSDPTVVNMRARATARTALDEMTAVAKKPQHPAFNRCDLGEVLQRLNDMRRVLACAAADVEAIRAAYREAVAERVRRGE